MSTTPDRIELMQTFVRIVEAGSLSAAALQMNATQPTVSRRLQALEKSLGLRLLKRSTHAMALTEEGDRCFARAKELLANWAAFESDLRGTTDVPEGTLRVVVPHAFGQQQLVEPLARYLTQYPGMAVEWLLHDGTPDFVASGIDCAIHVGRVDDPALVAIKLSEVPRIVVAAPALANRLPVNDVHALASLPWLALRTYYLNEVALQHNTRSDSCQFGIRPRVSTDSLFALRSAALHGLGACLTSAWVVADDVASGRLMHLVPEWHAAPLEVHLVYPYARFYPAKLRHFAQLLRAHLPVGMGLPAFKTDPA
jgi:DNA-binding transcriptional LysR family regulator